MPCESYETGSREGDRQLERERHKDEMDKLTRLLCLTCAHLEAVGSNLLDRGIPEEVNDWWREHTEQDRQRLDREREKLAKVEARERALNKLTEEERRLLGV